MESQQMLSSQITIPSIQTMCMKKYIYTWNLRVCTNINIIRMISINLVCDTEINPCRKLLGHILCLSKTGIPYITFTKGKYPKITNIINEDCCEFYNIGFEFNSFICETNAKLEMEITNSEMAIILEYKKPILSLKPINEMLPVLSMLLQYNHPDNIEDLKKPFN